MIWFRPELRVLFVCTANVCRSPLAEGLLRHRLRELGLAGRVQVRSAGISVAQRGRRPDPRVEKVAAEEGVSLARIRSRLLTPKMVQRSDYVLVMEREHLESVQRLYTGDCPDKIVLLGSFLPFQEAGSQDIPDPYFSDLQGIHNIYEMIDSALTGFLAHIGTRLGESRDS